MRKISIVLAITAVLSMQSVLAYEDDAAGSKPCATIANACRDAGYSRKEGTGKKFWQDCMKPVVIGKNVKGVTVDTATVKACQVDKISELKKEITELESASKS